MPPFGPEGLEQCDADCAFSPSGPKGGNGVKTNKTQTQIKQNQIITKQIKKKIDLFFLFYKTNNK